MSDVFSEYIRGITKDNPVFALVLGLCPALAVTTSVENALGMSAGTAFVLICSNVLVSALRKQIPASVRLPIFILIIATFVSIVEMVMEAYTPDLFTALGVFIPLIVVNCIIIGRAEAYANRNGVFYSFVDALGIASGFLVALVAIGGIREIFGTGQIEVFGHLLFTVPMMNPATYMILSPGAFLTIGILMAMINYRKAKKLERGE